MDCWFMVFEKVPNNNMEVPLYFLQKLWEEFMLGLHVNYFDISGFQGVFPGFSQDRQCGRHNPELGPRSPQRILVPSMYWRDHFPNVGHNSNYDRTFGPA